MKQRLYGLMALVLCAMMVVAPAWAENSINQLVYTSTPKENQSKVVAEEDIILNKSVGLQYETNDSSGTATIIYEGTDYSNQTIEASATGNLNDTMKINGWRVRSIEPSESQSSKALTMYVEAANFPVATGTLSADTYVVAFPQIFTPKTPLGFTADLDTREKIESRFQQYATEKGYGQIVSFREMGVYRYIDSASQILRKLDLTDITVRLTESNRSPFFNQNASVRLLHMKTDGSIEDMPVTITNGSYTVTLSSMSPFAIAYDPAGSANPGVSAGSGIPAPSAPSLPRTGDHSQLALWFALAVLSLTGMALAIRRRKA